MGACVKETPILFSGEMIRAILDGRKCQTRRVCKTAYTGEWADSAHPARDGMPIFWWSNFHYSTQEAWRKEMSLKRYETGTSCPYGQPGDRLWVRETWRGEQGAVEYRADTTSHGPADGSADSESPNWRPSIFMPRWASRITLEVQSVRVERLADISEADCEIELGVAPYSLGNDAYPRFRTLWDAINGKRPGCAWADSPWVWVVNFRVLT